MTVAEKPTRTYRMVWWVWCTNALGGLVLILVALLPFTCYSAFLFLISGDKLFDANVVASILRKGLSDVMLIGITLLGVVSGIGISILSIAQGRLSYLSISPDGLEYEEWPFYHVRCRWNDAESLASRKYFGFRTDELRLNQAEQSGLDWAWRYDVWERRLLGKGTGPAIPLSQFQGWRDGALSEALWQSAPHVFGVDDVYCEQG